jgi:hypothetical protein
VPITIPEPAYFRIAAAAEWLDASARAQFCQDVAAALAGREFGEGTVSRAIDQAFRAHFHAPLDSGTAHEPRHLKKFGRADD